MHSVCKNAKQLCYGGEYPIVMATVTIEDPEEYRKEAPVDTRGRVTIGKQYANKRVTVTVEVMDDE